MEAGVLQRHLSVSRSKLLSPLLAVKAVEGLWRVGYYAAFMCYWELGTSKQKMNVSYLRGTSYWLVLMAYFPSGKLENGIIFLQQVGKSKMSEFPSSDKYVNAADRCCGFPVRCLLNSAPQSRFGLAT